MRTVAILALFTVYTACQSETIIVEVNDGSGDPVSYSKQIQPIFNTSCSGPGCHAGSGQHGVVLTSYDEVMDSYGLVYDSPIVIPGNASISPITDKVGPSPIFGERMPLGQPPLSNEEIQLLRDWIEQGAKDN